jgi:hypothetical protein
MESFYLKNPYVRKSSLSVLLGNSPNSISTFEIPPSTLKILL